MITFFNSIVKKPGLPPNPVLAGANIIADGNSIVYGAVVGTGNSWPAQIQTIAPFDSNGCAWINMGVNGQKTTQMLYRFDSDIVPLKSVGVPNIYLAMEITNDIYFGATAEEAYNNIRSLCLKARSRGFYVGVFNCLPRSNAGTPVDFETTRQSVNSMIGLNNSFSDFVIDIASDTRIGQDGDEEDTEYYEDLVHPTIEGQAVLADITKIKVVDYFS